MNHTITTTLGDNLFNFLNTESNTKNITKKSIIEKGLEYYKKHELEAQIKKGFESRKNEYRELNSEFSDVQFNSIKD